MSSTDFYKALLLAAQHTSPHRSTTRIPRAPPTPPYPLPTFDLTTLAPLHPVHDIILSYLLTLCPVLLLRVSRSFHTTVLPRLYKRAVLHADNAAGFFYGVTEGPEGGKAQALRLVESVVFTDAESVEAIVRELHAPPTGPDNPFWRLLPTIPTPLFPNATQVQLGWPVLRFFLTPPHCLVTPSSSPVSPGHFDEEDMDAESLSRSSMTVYAETVSRTIAEQFTGMQALCVDIDGGGPYDAMSVEKVYEAVVYSGRLGRHTHAVRNPLAPARLTLRVHLQPSHTAMPLPTSLPTSTTIVFLQHPSPSRQTPPDEREIAHAIYNRFRASVTGETVYVVPDVEGVRRELESLAEDMGMERDGGIWRYMWRSLVLKDADEGGFKWEAPGFD
ncbi:hypothetical protein IAT38_002179 [Cryptococcus sp. DSM 104549]